MSAEWETHPDPTLDAILAEVTACGGEVDLHDPVHVWLYCRCGQHDLTIRRIYQDPHYVFRMIRQISQIDCLFNRKR